MTEYAARMLGIPPGVLVTVLIVLAVAAVWVAQRPGSSPPRHRDDDPVA